MSLGPQSAPARPRFSIVIPVHNEAAVLRDELVSLTGELDARGLDYELLVCENGSSDETRIVAEEMAAAHSRLRALHIPQADYGAAMKAGMTEAQGDLVVSFDIDFHDVDFMLRAANLASDYGVVVGSKLAPGSEDTRSPARHLITLGFTLILRALFDPRMDDTHGMKLVRRDVVRTFAPETAMTKDLFDTELIIRARRAGVPVKAIPVRVQEKRKPRSNIARRIPRTLKGLVGLRLLLWREGRTGSSSAA